MIVISDIRNCDYEKAADIIWKSFYFSEGRDYPVSVLEDYRDTISAMSLRMNSYGGMMDMICAFDGDEMVGVSGISLKTYPGEDHLFDIDKNAVILLYTAHGRCGEGIGKALLGEMMKRAADKASEHGDEETAIYVNSSDSAVGFYSKFGFSVCGERNMTAGVNSTPMLCVMKSARK